MAAGCTAFDGAGATAIGVGVGAGATLAGVGGGVAGATAAGGTTGTAGVSVATSVLFSLAGGADDGATAGCATGGVVTAGAAKHQYHLMASPFRRVGSTPQPSPESVLHRAPSRSPGHRHCLQPHPYYSLPREPDPGLAACRDAAPQFGRQADRRQSWSRISRCIHREHCRGAGCYQAVCDFLVGATLRHLSHCNQTAFAVRKEIQFIVMGTDAICFSHSN